MALRKRRSPLRAQVAKWPKKLAKIGDSKKISEKNREKIYERLLNSDDVGYGIGIISVEEIDRTNILQAALKAMEIAVEVRHASRALEPLRASQCTQDASTICTSRLCAPN